MFYVVSCPLGLLSTTVRPCTSRASHADAGLYQTRQQPCSSCRQV